MRIKFSVVIVLLVSLFATCPASTADPIARLVVQVKDDAGEDLSEVTVVGSTFREWLPGPDFGRNENTVREVTTDAQGSAILEMESKTGRIVIGARTPKGYYASESSEVMFTNTVEDRWLPWGRQLDIVLDRMLNPIAMYAKRVGIGSSLQIPEAPNVVGYDLLKGDLVEPHGSGVVADFLMKFSRNEERTVQYGPYDRDIALFDIRFVLGFSNPKDGIQPAPLSSALPQGLRVPREAPLDGYLNELELRMQKEYPANPMQSDFDDRHNYFFRVQTQQDSGGSTTNALYGKIHGEFALTRHGELSFTYYLNPNPNDRNLEFDPKQNLFTNLPAAQLPLEP